MFGVSTTESGSKNKANSKVADTISGRRPSPILPHSVLTHESNLEILFILSNPGLKRPALPAEVVLQILSYPSRWIQTAQISLAAPISVTDREVCKAAVCTPPLTAASIRCLRRVVFTFRSQDQGWCSLPEEGSWTWFEVAVGHARTLGAGSTSGEEEGGEEEGGEEEGGEEEGEEEEGGEEEGEEEEGEEEEWEEDHQNVTHNASEPRREWWSDGENRKTQYIQANRLAARLAENYHFEFDAGQEILRYLKEGDEIALLACARYPGWTNFVQEAAIGVWELDDLQA